MELLTVITIDIVPLIILGIFYCISLLGSLIFTLALPIGKKIRR